MKKWAATWIPIVLSAVAIVVTIGHAAISTKLTSVAVMADLVRAASPSCGEYQSRVVELANEGLSKRQIRRVLNASLLPDFREGDPYDKFAMGPGYDGYFVFYCGELGLILDHRSSVVAPGPGSP